MTWTDVTDDTQSWSAVACWVMRGGIWNDNCTWRDTATWVDSAWPAVAADTQTWADGADDTQSWSDSATDTQVWSDA